MYWNYLKLAFRNILKQKGYSIINILGLTTGIAALILIYIYINDELSYDQHWEAKDRIYRVSETMNLSGQEDRFGPTSINIAETFTREFPEIETGTKLFFAQMQTIRKGDVMINFPDFYYADSLFFDVFDYDIIAGSAKHALTDPKSVVLKKEVADRFFPDSSAIGQTLELNGQTLKVTAIIADNGKSTHLDFYGLRSIYSFSAEQLQPYTRDWFRICCYTYLKAVKPLDLEQFNQKVDTWTKNTIDPWIAQHDVNASAKFDVQPITDIHFDLSRSYDHPSNTNIKYLYIFGLVGLFIILIASINYINMATARSIRRAKEVGIRKVSGANRQQLFIQFITESMLITLAAALLALMLAELALPVFNTLLDKQYSISQLLTGNHSTDFIFMLIIVWLTTGLLSGIYPSIVMSGFSPAKALKSGSISKASNSKISTATLRKALVVLQFAISTAMIFSTAVVFFQLEYMSEKKLGFDDENVLIFNDSRRSPAIQKIDVMRQELLKNPNIEKVAATSCFPGYNHGRLLFYIEKEGEMIQKTMSMLYVDQHFADFMGLDITRGRFYSEEYENDATESFVLNEAAVKFLGEDNPVGLKMMCGLGVDGKVIGVVNDYNFQSLHKDIEPMVMLLSKPNSYRIGVKMKRRDKATIAHLETLWGKYDQSHPFIYSWLDDKLDKQYSREENMLTIFMYFSILVLFIACLGLLALAAYTAEQRTRENGIRKALGGSITHIVSLQMTETAKLVIIAGFLATPAAWLLMERWLQDFAYAISIQWYFGALGIFATLFIAFLTVITIAYRAAKANPVEALKYE